MSELNKTLEDVFGYTSFRPGQEEVINYLMQKKKTVSCNANRSREVYMLSTPSPPV